jgi:hypothetical protein
MPSLGDYKMVRDGLTPIPSEAGLILADGVTPFVNLSAAKIAALWWTATPCRECDGVVYAPTLGEDCRLR